MPRRARFVVPGLPFHLTHRGNNKKNIFHSDEDKRRYLFWFEEARKKNRMRVLSFCLMDNHVHYVAIADHVDAFAKVIHCVHRRYSAYFNDKYGSTGHLWEGRYYSCLLDQQHLTAALRYVERNPVRAGLVEKPWDWVWSSAREHLNHEKGYINLENIKNFLPILSWKNYIDQVENEEDLNEVRRQTMSFNAWADLEYKEQMESEYGVQLIPKVRGRRSK